MAGHHVFGRYPETPFLILVFLCFWCFDWNVHYRIPVGVIYPVTVMYRQCYNCRNWTMADRCTCGLFPLRNYPRNRILPAAPFLYGERHLANPGWQAAHFIRAPIARIGHCINPSCHIHLLHPNLPRHGLVETADGLFFRAEQPIGQREPRSAFVRVGNCGGRRVGIPFVPRPAPRRESPEIVNILPPPPQHPDLPERAFFQPIRQRLPERRCPPRNPRRFPSPIRVPAYRPSQEPVPKEKEQ